MTNGILSAQTALCSLLLFTPEGAAFSPTSTQPELARSAVVQRYRHTEEEEQLGQDVSRPSRQTDVYSFLPKRLSSSIEQIDTPEQFNRLVLSEDESLVVVRFVSPVCNTCRSTGPIFRKWSRDVQFNCETLGGIENGKSKRSFPVKFTEMTLNRATSSFIQNELNVEQIPHCHLYHPLAGLVVEQTVANKQDFKNFVDIVEGWRKGECCIEPFYSEGDDFDCIEFC